MDLSRTLGWLPAEQYISSPRAKPPALTNWHRPEYVEALQRAEHKQYVTPEETAQFNLGTLSNPVFRRSSADLQLLPVVLFWPESSWSMVG